jgi:hypothetical protein
MLNGILADERRIPERGITNEAGREKNSKGHSQVFKEGPFDIIHQA